MKKVLVVCGQEIIEIRNDGGKKCSYRNYELYTINEQIQKIAQ